MYVAFALRVWKVPALSLADNRAIVRAMCPSLPDATLDRLVSVIRAAESRSGSDDMLAKAVSMSTRRLIRTARRLERFPQESLADAVDRACLGSFLPLLARQALERLFVDHGLERTPAPPCEIMVLISFLSLSRQHFLRFAS